MSALHMAVSAAAEALVAVGAKTDPMRIHNERVLSRLFSALEQRAAPAGSTRSDSPPHPLPPPGYSSPTQCGFTMNEC